MHAWSAHLLARPATRGTAGWRRPRTTCPAAPHGQQLLPPARREWVVGV